MQITTKDINALRQLRTRLQSNLSELDAFLERAGENDHQPRKRANLKEQRKTHYDEYLLGKKKTA